MTFVPLRRRSSRARRPARSDRPLAGLLEPAQVDHRRRRPRQLARVQDKVRPRPDRRGHLLDAPCVGRRRSTLADDCRTTHRAPRQQRHGGHAQARAPSPPASGNRPRGFGSSSVTPAGQQPRHQRPGTRAELRQRGDREPGVEEHHRARLVRRPPLERVHPLDRRGALGVAREPVDGVRGEHRHAARGDAGLELSGAQRRPSRGRRSRARPRRPTRLISAATAAACPAPTSSARNGTSDGLLHQPPDDVEPVLAAEQRAARLEPHVGRQPVARRDVGRVGDDGVGFERRRAGRRGRTRRRGRAARRSRARRRGRPRRSRWRPPTDPAARPSVPARSRPTRCRRRPPARRAGSDKAASTTNSVSGRGTSTRGSTLSISRRNPFSPRM